MQRIFDLKKFDTIDPNGHKINKKLQEISAVTMWKENKGSKLPNGKMLRKKLIAQKHGIKENRMTLILQDSSKIGEIAGTNQRVSTENELKLVNWIIQRCEAKVSTTRVQVINKANKVLKRQNRFALDTKRGILTDSWYYKFYFRHKKALCRRRVEGLDVSREKGRSTARVIEYYSFMRDLLVDVVFKQGRIFNLDETPNPLSDIAKYSIWAKHIKEAHVMQPDNRLQITVMALIAANGTAGPPLFIYQGKTVDMSYISEGMDILLACNETSYMTKEIFRSWCPFFVQYSKPTEKDPVLLIFDNFGGHLDWEAFEYLNNNHVYIVGLPEHTSDLTQPLDLAVFGPYKIAYRKETENIKEQMLINRLEQRDFMKIMQIPYKSAFTSNNISSGFQRAGIVPFVPLNVLTKCRDWDPDIYAKYVPNEDKTEIDWKLMRNDENICQFDATNVEKVIDEDENLEYIETLLTFTRPTALYENQVADPIRLDVYNSVCNLSDLRTKLERKQVFVREMAAKKQEIKIRREAREEAKAVESKIQTYLEMTNLVRCKCKAQCTKRCPCRKANQVCIVYCGCTCEGRTDSSNNRITNAYCIESNLD